MILVRATATTAENEERSVRTGRARTRLSGRGDQFLNRRHGHQKQLGLRLCSRRQGGVQLRLLVGGERLARGDGLEGSQAGGAHLRKVPGGGGNFLGQEGCLRQLRENRVIPAPASELVAEFAREGGVTAGTGQKPVHPLRELARRVALRGDGVHQAVERSLAGGFDGGGFFALVVFHRFHDIGQGS